VLRLDQPSFCLPDGHDIRPTVVRLTGKNGLKSTCLVHAGDQSFEIPRGKPIDISTVESPDLRGGWLRLVPTERVTEFLSIRVLAV
jgi:hypothetical protein